MGGEGGREVFLNTLFKLKGGRKRRGWWKGEEKGKK